MRSRLGRIPAVPFLTSLLFAAICGSSGCQLNRSFFQIDSDSRSPYFGVDLTPKWPMSASDTDAADRSLMEQTSATSVKPEVASAETPPPQSMTLPFGEAPTTASLADAAPVEKFR